MIDAIVIKVHKFRFLESVILGSLSDVRMVLVPSLL